MHPVKNGGITIPHAAFSQQFIRFLHARLDNFVADLPDSVHVYRGQDASAHLGLSWTTDIDVARGFAEGHRGIMHDCPAVYAIEVRRSHIAFVHAGRGESEVVLIEITDDIQFSVEQLY